MKTMLIDTHVHTSEVSPCGQVAADEMVRYYKKAGYDGIVITDHYYEGYFAGLSSRLWERKVDSFLSGYKAASEEGEQVGLKVYLGMEIRFQEGPEDYLVYGIDEEYIKKNPELYRHTLESFRESIEGGNMLIFQAHPYRMGLKVAEPYLLDGVEILNGNPRHNSRNELALAFARKHGLKMIAGSDAHQPQDVGAAGIRIAKDIHTSTELAKWMYDNASFELYNSQSNLFSNTRSLHI